MGDSFLGNISRDTIRRWLAELKKENGEAPDDLDLIDRFFARWTMGARKMEKMNDCTDPSSTHIRTYLCQNKKNEQFYFVKIRTDKPAYNVESIPFDKDSVLQELKKCEQAGSGQPM